MITGVSSNQFLSLSNIVALASAKPKAQGIAQSVYADVDFGAEPAPAAAQTLGFLAPLFWGAPAAQEWARTMVLSRIRFSISGHGQNAGASVPRCLSRTSGRTFCR